MSFITALFYVVSALMVFTAVRTVTAVHVFRSALYLAATLSLVAVQYLLLGAEFVAVVQLLVYVGAVIVLIIFAVMLTAQLGDERISQTNRLALPAALGCGAVFYAMSWALTSTDWSKVTPAPADPALQGASGNLQAVGLSLLSTYVYPFEIVGLILFTALVGAVLIARKDIDAPKEAR
ncbi:MAG TPA: NADH-quinone oxidoreductase subunit J [bacterium]|jgi:NADH-quinone oxidoreductase subunit J|nr:NADH-quinone oxidoreductase subunit J [bacterium]